MNPVTVTNEDFTMEAAVARLEALLASEPLTLTVKGGGLPDEQSLVPDRALVIARDEVETLVWLLKKIMRISREEPHLVPAGPHQAGTLR